MNPENFDFWLMVVGVGVLVSWFWPKSDTDPDDFDPDPPEPPPVPPKPEPPTPTLHALTVEINAFRQQNNRPALQESPCLMDQAQKHAESMRRRRRMSHDGFYLRLQNCGVSGAENVAMGTDGPERIVRMWANSSGHRKNMLRTATTIGVGISGGYSCAIIS